MKQLGNHTNAQIEENSVRHMILNTIRSYKQKYSKKYGKLVIACDNHNYWREKYFPYYKVIRKRNSKNSELDWKTIFICLDKIREELKEYFPYKVIDIESAEADDIIGTLVHHFGEAGSPILILSRDKDFIQLQSYVNVDQYDPIDKRVISHPNPSQFLKEHIIRGDMGDSIPNILSQDDCFMHGIRQKSLTKKRFDALLAEDIDKWQDDVRRNYYRNERLIDLNLIPESIKSKVMESYYNQGIKDRSKLVEYFMKYKLKNLMECISEF